jgi:hypothetical protein
MAKLREASQEADREVTRLKKLTGELWKVCTHARTRCLISRVPRSRSFACAVIAWCLAGGKDGTD